MNIFTYRYPLDYNSIQYPLTFITILILNPSSFSIILNFEKEHWISTWKLRVKKYFLKKDTRMGINPFENLEYSLTRRYFIMFMIWTSSRKCLINISYSTLDIQFIQKLGTFEVTRQDTILIKSTIILTISLQHINAFKHSHHFPVFHSPLFRNSIKLQEHWNPEKREKDMYV